MLRSIIWLLTAAVGLIIITPLGLLVRLFQNKDPYSKPPAVSRWVVENIIPLIVRLGGCCCKVTGTENIPEGAALYTGNHQGNFDVGLILYALGGYKIPIAKIEASKVPLANIWMRSLHLIFIRRGDARQSAECMNTAAQQLEHGNSVVVFPEGTRSKRREMNEFKAGAFKPALKAGVPVVPFVIDGTYKCFEETGKLRKADVTLHILPPVYPEKLGITKTKDLAPLVQDMIQKQLDENASGQHIKN